MAREWDDDLRSQPSAALAATAEEPGASWNYSPGGASVTHTDSRAGFTRLEEFCAAYREVGSHRVTEPVPGEWRVFFRDGGRGGKCGWLRFTRLGGGLAIAFHFGFCYRATMSVQTVLSRDRWLLRTRRERCLRQVLLAAIEEGGEYVRFWHR